MSAPQPVIHTNGTTPAPRPTGGAGLLESPPTLGARQTPTVFPAEITGAGFGGLLYTLGRATILAFPLANWLLGATIALAPVLALQGDPWGWIGLGLMLAAAVLRVVVWQAARRDYVRFVQDPPAAPSAPEPLRVADKLPVYVTGCLEVGTKVRRFANLPGYYRTFATREHALLCLCRGGRRLLVGAWPETEVGLWYGFFTPAALRQIGRGTLHFGRRALPALRVEVSATPTRGRVRRRAVETLYLAAEPALLARIEADLRADAPAASHPAPQPTFKARS